DSIADVAKSNVTAIGEVANASNEMARLAAELKELVSSFSILKTGEAVTAKVVEHPGKNRVDARRPGAFKKTRGAA
ncbi:MAG: hypothetical protein Q8P48_07865, partial [Deltaproteobacteria bacterium]|nr:hypothetical protein [Deltaproteobacteria bacterium]